VDCGKEGGIIVTDNLRPLSALERLVVGVALYHYYGQQPENVEFPDANDLPEKFRTGWNYASMAEELETMRILGKDAK